MIFEDEVALAFRDISPQVLYRSRDRERSCMCSWLLSRPPESGWLPTRLQC